MLAYTFGEYEEEGGEEGGKEEGRAYLWRLILRYNSIACGDIPEAWLHATPLLTTLM
jgi:hypothetical protein